ncbi:MAG: Fe-S cluster assembly scaffold SufA [Anderseniella sp.]|jgi:iron-sulfur cluster assembly protein|nr:Fe-S cluster assembly scaffold SufA [Anderseniella sp.]
MTAMDMNTSNPRQRPQVLTLTDAAAARIRDLMQKSGKDGAGLRIGVKNGGCAGMEYTMQFVDEPEKFDEIIEDKGARVIVEAKAVLFLFGTKMDYEVTKLRSGFIFTNPNQTSACGCGESVELKAVDASVLGRN